MRARLLAAAVVAAAVTPIASASAEAEKRYVRIDVAADYTYVVDRGTTGSITGRFTWSAQYRLHAIAVFDGSRVTTPGGGSAVVVARLDVHDQRRVRKLVDGTWRDVPYCVGWDGADSIRGAGTGPNGVEYVAGRGASVAVGSDGRLRVSPGAAARVGLKHCSDSETLQTHGLAAGPGFTLPAPGKQRFRGTKRFSLACLDQHSHGPKHGVDAFEGHVAVQVTVTPFPARSLAKVRGALRDRIGDTFRPVSLDTKSPKTCL